jgi:hypothetical protein
MTKTIMLNKLDLIAVSLLFAYDFFELQKTTILKITHRLGEDREEQ